MKPTVLVATTTCWIPTVRLGIALAKAGFTVKALCSARHPLRMGEAAGKIYTYHGLAPILSLTKAIAEAKPDIIIPGDDLATEHLHELYQRRKNAGEAGEATCALIERSLGAPESFPVVYSRTKFIKLAHEEGVRVPEMEVIANLGGLAKWIERRGLPAVLKADGSSGGMGVRIVATPDAAERAFRALDRPPLWARALKRALIDGDTTLVWPSLLRRRPAINAQSFLPGHEATSTVACWKGRVLAAVHFDVLRKASPTGHATVLRLVENAEMSSAAEKMVRRLNLSGLHGFDFIREVPSGRACLIELNPRTTQVGHLALGPGRDLPVALYAAVSGEDVQAPPPVTEKDTFALFPHEWLRDAASPHLQSAFHDVPWEAPELVLACIRRHRQQRPWYSTKAADGSFAQSFSDGYVRLTKGSRNAALMAREGKS